VTKDIKAINEMYKLGINNTERGTDSYAYPATDYAVARDEQDEGITLKRKIAQELNGLTQKASRGLKEDYLSILTSLDKLKSDIQSIILKV